MKRILTVIVAVVVAVGMFFAGYFAGSYKDEDLSALKFVLDNYKKYYLNEEENYLDIMIDSLLEGDKYSEYYSAEEYEIIKKSAEGKQAGVGVAVNETTLEIVRVVGNSPAEKSGVKAGGKITAYKKSTDSEFTSATTITNFNDFMSKVLSGEEICLKVLYKTEEEFVVKKQEYQETFVYYVDDRGAFRFSDASGQMQFVSYQDDLTGVLDEQTAYIRYTSFNGRLTDLSGSVKQFETALEKFKANEKSKLIVDLRGNGGGFMDIMCKIASHLVGTDKKNPLISKAIYKDGKVDKFTAQNIKYDLYDFEKIVFLADDGTASASEALIGACLDYDSRDVVRVVLSKNADGSYKTYGKGIMQTTTENLDGSAIKLTTAQIYWPQSDITIHRVGVNKSIEKYKNKIIEAPYLEGVDYELSCALSL
ncbi:MAG: hypothetical protein IJW64_01360 [Clostridia bacterium]|nr:hypothetical protein [Clostridia bacterium]